MNYKQIFESEEENSLTKLRPLLPEFYWAKKTKGGDKWKICIENLLYGLENGSFIDIKLGTSTLID